MDYACTNQKISKCPPNLKGIRGLPLCLFELALVVQEALYSRGSKALGVRGQVSAGNSRKAAPRDPRCIHRD